MCVLRGETRHIEVPNPRPSTFVPSQPSGPRKVGVLISNAPVFGNDRLSLLQVVKEDLKEDEAEELKAKLEAAGATVELE